MRGRTGPDRKCRGLLALAGSMMLGGALHGQGAAPPPGRAASARTQVITIENMRFSPQSLSVRPGDRVVWINKDLFPHTATATGKAFDSRSIGPNASYTFVARAKGEFVYGCTFHPTMTGTLEVR